jgi:hypothetical protein
MSIRACRLAVLAGVVGGVVGSAACGGPERPKPTAPAATPDPETVAAVAVIDEALAARPDDVVLLYLRASMTTQVGPPAGALPFLARLDAAGWDVPLAPSDFGALAEDRRFRELATRIEARAPTVHRSVFSFGIEGPDLIPEGIAADPARERFYVGSLRKRTIVAVSGAVGHGPALQGVAARQQTTFVPPRRDGLGAVVGIKVDGARGLLWAASYASPSMEGYTPADRTSHAVYAFALADGALRRRVAYAPAEAAEPHLPNDLAITEDGTVYVTDSNAGRVYRVPAAGDVLEPIVPPRSFFYPNGIVPAPGGKLYVAHATGIALVDPATGAITRVEPPPGPPPAPLGGIDGLALHRGALVAVQNSIGRPRLVKIALDDTGARATSLTVLENDPKSLELPTTTAVLGDHAYTIANSQLDALSPEGLRKGRKLEDPRILRTPL